MFKKIKEFIYLVGNSFIWQPLRGDNGITNPNELAKWLITWVGVWMVFQEGIHTGQQFTDTQFGIVFAAVVAIAGIQLHYESKGKEKENE